MIYSVIFSYDVNIIIMKKKTLSHLRGDGSILELVFLKYVAQSKT